jgi:quinol monooxygenase YgiN
MSDAPRNATIAVTSTFHAKPGEETRLMDVLRRLAEAVLREESGCLLYLPVRSRHEASRFMLLERYRDEKALTDHANSAHLRDALPDLMGCLASLPELVIYEELDPA